MYISINNDVSGGDLTVTSSVFTGPSILRGKGGLMIIKGCKISQGGQGGTMISVAGGCRLYVEKSR